MARRSKTTAALLLSVLCLFGLMAGTASAKPGLINVNRNISLNIQRLTAGTARYFGAIEFSRATIVKVATAKTGGKKSEAAVAKTKKAPLKKRNRASQLAEEFCVEHTRSTLVQVHHLSNPEFLIGLALPGAFLDYSVTGNAAPVGDQVRARQGGATAPGTTEPEPLQTGPFEWVVNCASVETIKTMP